MTNLSIKVAIADQYSLSAKSLAALLSKYSELQLMGDVRSCEELLMFLEKNPADIALIDMLNSDHSKLSICKKIALYFPSITMIALSPDYNRQTALKLKEYGVEGYLTKDLEPAIFINEIFKVAATGRSSGGRLVVKKECVHEHLKSRYHISSRELEVISLMGQGLSSAKIGEKLCISLNTVKQHRKHIFQKLHLKNVQEVVAFSVRNSI